MKSGRNLRSVLRISDAGQEKIAIVTHGGVTARVVDPDTNETVGGYAGFQTMPRIKFRIGLGDSIEIPLLVGTASSVSRLGYAVPPGRGAIEVILNLEGKGSFRTPLLPIIVEGK